MSLPDGTAPSDVLPRNNIFGLSNSAYRSDALRRCLPVPPNAVAVDWYLVTRAWLLGSSLGFDPTARMDYRQHGSNIARVRPPFTPGQVAEDTELVRLHFAIAQASPSAGTPADRRDLLAKVATDVEGFRNRVVLDPPRLERYVLALNALGPAPVWWWCVAHPSLRGLWESQ
jgi:hypothetical protein